MVEYNKYKCEQSGGDDSFWCREELIYGLNKIWKTELVDVTVGSGISTKSRMLDHLLQAIHTTSF